MDFNEFIKSFPIRMDIFDDITYLQKHLRLIIRFHQKLSSKLYVVRPDNSDDSTAYPSKNYSAMREFMDELETEMEDISREQKMLTDVVRKCLSQYSEMLANEHGVTVDHDVAEGFITRALQYHYQKHNANITPSNVKIRMCEDELKQKYDEIRTKSESDRALQQLVGRKSLGQAAQQQQQQQESLIKPSFRKPTGLLASSGRVEKKTVVTAKNPVIAETRHAKVIHKNHKNADQQQLQQQGITEGRMNLLRALNKVKIDQIDNKQYSDNGKYIRSDEDCSDQSSSDGPILDTEIDPLKITRKHRRSPASNASSDSDWMKSLPPLPKEPPPKMDYTQEEFLSLFQLTIPQIAEEIKLQRSKRKRRNCFKNEKNDFHYGNFDLNEAAYRLRMCNNRRSILYSPNNKRK